MTEQEFTKSQTAQLKTLDKLQEKTQKVHSGKVDFRGTQLKKWVTVLSNSQPTEDKIRVMGRGLNFVTAPEKMLANQVITTTEAVCHEMMKVNKDDEGAVQLRHKVIVVTHPNPT